METSMNVSVEERFFDFTAGIKNFKFCNLIDIRGGEACSFPVFDITPQKLSTEDVMFMKFFKKVLVPHFSAELDFRGWTITKFFAQSAKDSLRFILVYEICAIRKSDGKEVSLLVFGKEHELGLSVLSVLGWTSPIASARSGLALDLEKYLEAGLVRYVPELENESQSRE